MKLKPLLAGCSLITFFSLSNAVEMPNTVSTKALSQALASQAVAAAVEACTTKGYKVGASLSDRHGNLQAFLRNPLAGPHTIKISQQKAYTSATLQAPTSELGARPDLSFAPDLLLITGGVPISIGGVFYGGIGVSGADPEVDEECAMAGVEAISETLTFGEF